MAAMFFSGVPVMASAAVLSTQHEQFLPVVDNVELTMLAPSIALPATTSSKRCTIVTVRKFQGLGINTSTRAAPAVVAYRKTCF